MTPATTEKPLLLPPPLSRALSLTRERGRTLKGASLSIAAENEFTTIRSCFLIFHSKQEKRENARNAKNDSDSDEANSSFLSRSISRSLSRFHEKAIECRIEEIETISLPSSASSRSARPPAPTRRRAPRLSSERPWRRPRGTRRSR